MNESETRIFLATMAEATVVDFDASAWDRHLRLVVAGGRDGSLSGIVDVFNIDFLRVTRMVWDASVPLAAEVGRPDVHTRWEIWHADLKELDHGYRVCLQGSGPTLELECDDIRIGLLSQSVLERISATWFEPGRPLLRPSLESLAEPGARGRK